MNARPLENISMTPEDYLEFEKDSEIRHEYCGGEIFAMTGASLNHNQINHNISGELRNRLKESHCRCFSSDMRIKVEVMDKYTYPDIVIACGDIKLEKTKGLDTLLNPIVIMEILSDSTEAYDRGEKFRHYRLIPSLMEYILVSQTHCLVERFVRDEDGGWKYFSYEDVGLGVKIESIDCELPLSEIYYRVDFEGNE